MEEIGAFNLSAICSSHRLMAQQVERLASNPWTETLTHSYYIMRSYYITKVAFWKKIVSWFGLQHNNMESDACLNGQWPLTRGRDDEKTCSLCVGCCCIKRREFELEFRYRYRYRYTFKVKAGSSPWGIFLMYLIQYLSLFQTRVGSLLSIINPSSSISSHWAHSIDWLIKQPSN